MIASYSEDVAQLDEDSYEDVWESAQEYNEELAKRNFYLQLSDEEREVYEKELNVSGNGIMGYIEIPSINVSLPIYHGTDESILQIAVGHIEGSSLPVGGESTHCVLSGHRGLPSAKLFTDLDQLVEGDYFMLQVLDETLTYEVDQILIVEPDEVDALAIEDGKDYCTLVTCTPYSINTERLLVRGHRVSNLATASEVRVTADATMADPVTVAPFLAIPVFLLLLIWLFAKPGRH
jgi:sortase A